MDDAMPVAMITFRYRQTHERMLAVIEDLTDEQIAWRPAPLAHPIASNLWHIARWADHLQAHLPGMTAELGRRLGPGRQIWDAEGLAARWGLDPAELGQDETGMLMDDETAARLPLPGKAALLDYAWRAFALAARAVAAIDEAQFLAPDGPERAANPTSTATVGSAVMAHLVHDNRHLGEVEYLRGLQGLRGTATR